jgi:hypothetical protein
MQKIQPLDEIPDKNRFVWETQITQKHSIFNCMKWGMQEQNNKKEHNKNANYNAIIKTLQEN